METKDIFENFVTAFDELDYRMRCMFVWLKMSVYLEKIHIFFKNIVLTEY